MAPDSSPVDLEADEPIYEEIGSDTQNISEPTVEAEPVEAPEVANTDDIITNGDEPESLPSEPNSVELEEQTVNNDVEIPISDSEVTNNPEPEPEVLYCMKSA